MSDDERSGKLQDDGEQNKASPPTPSAPRVLTAQDRKRQIMNSRNCTSSRSSFGFRRARSTQSGAIGNASATDSRKKRVRSSMEPTHPKQQDVSHTAKPASRPSYSQASLGIFDELLPSKDRKAAPSSSPPLPSASLFGKVMSRSGRSPTMDDEVALHFPTSAASTSLADVSVRSPESADDPSVGQLAQDTSTVKAIDGVGRELCIQNSQQRQIRTDVMLDASPTSSKTSPFREKSEVEATRFDSLSRSDIHPARQSGNRDDGCYIADNLSSPNRSPTPLLFDSGKAKDMGMDSPGGFSLLKVLDVVHIASPYRIRETAGKDGIGSGNLGEEDIDGDEEKHQDEDNGGGWKDARLILSPRLLNGVLGKSEMPSKEYKKRGEDLPPETYSLSQRQIVLDSETFPMRVGIIDWSLKRRIRLECQPSNALPGGELRCDGEGELDIEMLAMDIFLNGASASSTNNRSGVLNEEGRVAARWKAAQMYWRHPALYPLQNEGSVASGGVEGRKARGSLASINQTSAANNLNAGPIASVEAPLTVQQSSEQKAATLRSSASLFTERRQAKAHFMEFASANIKHNSSSSLSGGLCPREEDWIAAFRSVHNAWLTKISYLRSHLAHSSMDQIAEEVARTCFYTLSHNRSILFRCQLSKCEDGNGWNINPMTIISSTTSEIRTTLKSMGVSLHSLPHGSEFDERIFDSCKNCIQKDEEEEANKVHEELEELRRATAHGETAGAEISVSLRKKVGASSSRGILDEGILQPLYLSGNEDCMSFYEYFLNTCGRLHRVKRDSPIPDVPLILHRAFGPTLHATIDTLASGGRRGDDFWDLKAKRDKKVLESSHRRPFLEFNGPILPCALRDLLHVSICYLLQDKLRQVKVERTDTHSKEENEVGSHFLVCDVFGQTENPLMDPPRASKRSFAKTKEAATRTAYFEKETGKATSSLFNGGCDQWDDIEKACGPSEAVNMVVWNSRNPNVISFSTDESQA